MTHKTRGVHVEEYAYYVNKLRQNVGLETLMWRQIVTSQTAHTKYKWPPHTTVQTNWVCQSGVWRFCKNDWLELFGKKRDSNHATTGFQVS